MAELAREEVAELEASIADLERRLRLLLLPSDPLDDKDIMLEIRCAGSVVVVVVVVWLCL